MNNIITLCGSTKFKEEFLICAQHLTLMGDIALMPGVFGHSDGLHLDDEVKEMLDKLHKKKIAMSNGIYVINKGGYIGESTRSEIEFAKQLGIPIVYMEGVNE